MQKNDEDIMLHLLDFSVEKHLVVIHYNLYVVLSLAPPIKLLFIVTWERFPFGEKGRHFGRRQLQTHFLERIL